MTIRILIIDDEPHNLDVLRIYLQSLRYEIVEAVSGHDALRLIDRVCPDLILLDVMLPDISGYELCQRINERTDFAVPIIFLSANAQREAILKGLELGVFDYLTKPFDLDLLEKKLNIALQHRKNADKLFNRRLAQTIDQMKQQQGTFAVMTLLIDRFERIVNLSGHHTVELLLQAITRRLQSGNGRIGTVSRLGEDKLVIIVPNVSERQAEDIAAGIAAQIANEPFRVEGHEYFITVSIGVSLYPFDGDDVSTLVKNSDKAVRNMWDLGGSGYLFYKPDMDNTISRRMKVEAGLHRALERNELELYYQPKIDIQSGVVVGMEALIRWHSPELGTVSPAEFIPAAEETGLIIPIGEWVIRTACMQNRHWRQIGLSNMRVAVNLSARQFDHPRFVDTVRDILAQTMLEPELLEIEITEGLLVQKVETAIEALHELKRLGVHIAIDDFGTGYSSLSYLKKFPIHSLKIDQSFVRDMTNDASCAEITNAVIALGHSLNLKVVAEGVETREQLLFLKQRGCDEAQGYLFGKPLPAGQFETYLTQNEMLVR